MDSFIVYGAWEQQFSLLPPEKQGALMMALFAYINRGELPNEADPAVKMAFYFIKAAMDDNREKYAKTCAQRSEAGRAGGLAKSSKRSICQSDPSKPSKANDCLKNPSKPSLNDFEYEYDSESVPPNGGVKTRAKKASRFAPPTTAEVASYVTQRHSPVDPQEFIDFYASKGWLVGKTPMKDWKAACRNAEKWDRWQKKEAPPRQNSKRHAMPDGRMSAEQAQKDLSRLDKLLGEGGEAP